MDIQTHYENHDILTVIIRITFFDPANIHKTWTGTYQQ